MTTGPILASGELQVNPSNSRLNPGLQNLDELNEFVDTDPATPGPNSFHPSNWPVSTGIFEKQLLIAKMDERNRIKKHMLQQHRDATAAGAHATRADTYSPSKAAPSTTATLSAAHYKEERKKQNLQARSSEMKRQ